MERLAEIVETTSDNTRATKWVELNLCFPIDPLGRECPWVHEVSERLNAYIKDLKIESVTVIWHHQIDPRFADKPKMNFKSYSHRQLQIVKEYVSRDDTEFSELGSLGRYQITDNTKFLSREMWQKEFAKKKLIDNQLMSDQSRSISNMPQFPHNYSEDNFSTVYKMNIGEKLVVELIHVDSTAVVQWKVSTFTIIKSIFL